MILGALTLFTQTQNLELSKRNFELQRQNQQLQNLIYNYTPSMFVYPKYEVVVDLRKAILEPNGELDLVVVIVTPHNGYAFVNQTFFKLTNDSNALELLDSRLLDYTRVTIYRELIFAVPAGSFFTTLRIPFDVTVHLALEWLQPGKGGSFVLGSVGIKVTFYDAQQRSTYSTLTTAYLRVNFQNPIP